MEDYDEREEEERQLIFNPLFDFDRLTRPDGLSVIHEDQSSRHIRSSAGPYDDDDDTCNDNANRSNHYNEVSILSRASSRIGGSISSLLFVSPKSATKKDSSATTGTANTAPDNIMHDDDEPNGFKDRVKKRQSLKDLFNRVLNI